MVGILDILLFLAFAGAIAGTVVAKQPSGPEGPIGVWALLVIPCKGLGSLAAFVKGLLENKSKPE